MWEIFESLFLPALIKVSPNCLSHSQDVQIEREKQVFNITGGCTALTVVYLLGKLYVGNAGDSRCVYSVSDYTAVDLREPRACNGTTPACWDRERSCG